MGRLSILWMIKNTSDYLLSLLCSRIKTLLCSGKVDIVEQGVQCSDLFPAVENDFTLLTSCVQYQHGLHVIHLRLAVPEKMIWQFVGSTLKKPSSQYRKLLLADKVWLKLVISTGMDRSTILCKQLPWPMKGFWKIPCGSLWQRSEVA